MTTAVLAMPAVFDPLYWLGEGGPFAAALLPGVIVIVFVETGLFFPFLPGDTLLVTTGLLAAQPNAPVGVWTLGFGAMLAAVAGGQLGYVVGRRLGPALFSRDEARFLKKRYLTASHAFFERHGRTTILIGHFVGVVRTFMPVVAGASGMPYRVFLVVDVIGAAAWAFGLTRVGYHLGTLPVVSAHLELIVLLVAALSVLPVAVSVGRTAVLRRRGPAGGGYRGPMASTSSEDRAADVAAGDLVDVDRGDGPRPFKVVHRDDTSRDGSPAVLFTFEDDDGETFDLEYAADAPVTRALESKWESEQVGRTPDSAQ